jgi:hypothetical protein
VNCNCLFLLWIRWLHLFHLFAHKT